MDFSVIRRRKPPPPPPSDPKPAAPPPPPPPGGNPSQYPNLPFPYDRVRSVEYFNARHWRVNFGDHQPDQHYNHFVYNHTPMVGYDYPPPNYHHSLPGPPPPDYGRYLPGPPPPDYGRYLPGPPPRLSLPPPEYHHYGAAGPPHSSHPYGNENPNDCATM